MSTILQEDSDNMTKDFAIVAKEWLAEETLSMQRKYLASCDHPNLSFGLIPLDQALRVDLALATRIWCCAICHMILFWPTVLAHPCARNPRSSALAVNLYIDSLRDVDSVIKACGKDPATILVADMDFCPVRLTCDTCAHENRREQVNAWKVFTWRAAVRFDFVCVSFQLIFYS